MHLFLLGASHHTTPVELRECIDFSKRGIPQALTDLVGLNGVSEAMVLSTCNRAEIYVICENPDRVRLELGTFIHHFNDVAPDLLTSHLYNSLDADAVRHLFRVVAGLDSLVVGESQILGQVKDAYTQAAEQSTSGVILKRLLPWSFAVGKRIRSDTGLGDGAISVSYAAVSLARKIFGGLQEMNVLLIGSGEMAELTAIHLRSKQVRRIGVASRTSEHADALAAKVNGVRIAWNDISNELVSSDIVVTATGSTTPLVTCSQIKAAMRLRRNRPLFIIDIALPRDVEASAGQIEQVFLYNIDDLKMIVSENLAKRRSQIEHAETMISEEVQGFMAWLHSRDSIPTIVALRQRFEAIREAELKRLEPKLSSLSPSARERVEEITRLLVHKLLSAPTEQLKSVSSQKTAAIYSDALSELFVLRGEVSQIETEDATTTSEKSAMPPTKNSVTS